LSDNLFHVSTASSDVSILPQRVPLAGVSSTTYKVAVHTEIQPLRDCNLDPSLFTLKGDIPRLSVSPNVEDTVFSKIPDLPLSAKDLATLGAVERLVLNTGKNPQPNDIDGTNILKGVEEALQDEIFVSQLDQGPNPTSLSSDSVYLGADEFVDFFFKVNLQRLMWNSTR
jgi:hypothetical protein